LRKIKPKNIIPEIGRNFKKKKLHSKKNGTDPILKNAFHAG